VGLVIVSQINQWVGWVRLVVGESAGGAGSFGAAAVGWFVRAGKSFVQKARAVGDG
jgi:hypothetical protein